MNEKNIKALLKGLGLPENVIAESEKDDFDASKVISNFNESQKAHYADIVKNEIAPGIEDEAFRKAEGKILGTVNNDLKKTFGVPMDKIKDLPLHEKLLLVKSTMEETYSKNPNADEIKKLQEEKMEWQNKAADIEKSIEQIKESAISDANKRVTAKLSDLSLTKTFHEIQADKIVGGHSEVMLWGLKSYMSNKYDWGLDEKENTVPYEKGTSKRVTLKDASGKEYFATASELMLNSLKETKGLKESNGGEGSGNNGRSSDGNGQQRQKSARLLEMEAKLAS